MISTDICSSVLRHWWYTEHEEFRYMKRSNRFIIPDSDVFYLHQIPISSLWIWTQWINSSVCLRETEWLLTLTQISSILIIQTDLMMCGRCCVERVCVDAVTGSWSGVEMCIYQCHIRASAGREVKSVCLDIMISPGVCSAVPPDTHSDTITYRLISLWSPSAAE